LEDNSENKLPKVSIIIPVKNMENTIKDLLDSIMQLDYPKDKVEVIIVDGGSNDKTLEIASKYPVKILREEGRGPNHGRKVGVMNATGEIYAFTDGDCILPRDWLKIIVEKLKDPEVGCVGGSVFVSKDLEDNLIAKYSDESIMRVMPIAEKSEKTSDVKIFKHLALCNMAVKRDVLNIVGGLREDMKTFEDVDLMASICKSGYKVLRSPEIYVWHKHRSNVRELIKQTFNYGRGAPKFFKNHPEAQIARMFMLGILAFIIYLVIVIVGLIMMINGNPTIVIAISTITLTALILDVMYYAIKTRNLLKALLYPLLDAMRIIAFASGSLIQTLIGG
jgi:glycosyltransferase involved in cell wall biosynthesis